MPQPGMFGRLAAQFPAAVRDLTYYVAGDLPAAPATVAVPDFPSWGMLGNDRYGDCGVAGLVHGFEADATVTKESEQWPDAEHVVDYYLSYTHGADTGVVLSQFLAYVRAQPDGLLGHTVDAYAPVNVHNVSALRSAVALFDFAYTGIVVTDKMQASFGAGHAWTTDDLVGAHVVGGHCVPAVGYDDTALYVVTWGKVQPVSWPCWHEIADEAWAVITGELVARDGDGRGVALGALHADLDRLSL